MGGKRPDQWQIDPAEAGATDYKWRHEGRSQGEQLADEDKQRLASNPHDQPMIPEEKVNPALRELRERKAAHRDEGEQGDERGATDGMKAETKEEELDESIQASFPASDPPVQP